MEKQKLVHALGILFSENGAKKRGSTVSRTFRFPKVLDDLLNDIATQTSQTKSDIIFINLYSIFVNKAIEMWCHNQLKERLVEYVKLVNSDKIASVEILNEIMRDMECIHSLVLKEQLEYADMSKAMKESADDIEATKSDISKLYSAKSLDDISKILLEIEVGAYS